MKAAAAKLEEQSKKQQFDSSFENLVHTERKKRLLSGGKPGKHDQSPLQMMRSTFRKPEVPKLETPSLRESQIFTDQPVNPPDNISPINSYRKGDETSGSISMIEDLNESMRNPDLLLSPEI